MDGIDSCKNNFVKKEAQLQGRKSVKKSIFGINYRNPKHRDLPHVVKFSGGRSSGMMLMKLLEGNILDRGRGDVVIFNNTSAEYPKTYEFVSKCKTICETEFGIPFFIVEHCTYEDAYQGDYIRKSTFRLVNDKPHSDSNPQGYRWRGEVYEELLSLNGVLPSVFQRTCTIALKLETTRKFLKEWFLNKSHTDRKGHAGETPRIDIPELHRRHLKKGGEVPIEVFAQKKEFVLNQPHVCPAQSWGSFSGAWKPFRNEGLSETISGDSVKFGPDHTEYVGLIGLRHDEGMRVQKVLLKASADNPGNKYSGEAVYAPLFDSGISTVNVMKYWNSQTWDLEIDPGKPLSNCTYCFLKGTENLRSVNLFFQENPDQLIPDTPTDINWWRRIESDYAKDFSGEGKETRTHVPDNIIGFFGARSGYLYKYISANSKQPEFEEDYPGGFVPCECTE